MLVVWVLLVFLACLVALLAVPVDLSFSVRRHHGQAENSATLDWLFGVARLRLGRAEMHARVEPGRLKVRPRRLIRGGSHRITAMLRTEGFGWRLLRLALSLLRRIHIRELRMEVRLGLDDPADTGRLWAVVGPLAAILTLPVHARVAIEPEFACEALEVDGKGCIRIIPIRLLFVVLVFLLSPGTLRTLHATRVSG